MVYLINIIDTACAPIATLQQLSQRIQPYIKLAWQAMTHEKTQRTLRAISMAVIVMGTIVLLGMLKTLRIAWQEATATMQNQLEPEMTPAVKSKSTATPPLPSSSVKGEALSAKTGVRALRTIATKRGIRNAGRMRKAELLAKLNITEGAIAQEG